MSDIPVDYFQNLSISPSPLVPSPLRSVSSTIFFSADLPTPTGEKWFIDINNRENNNFSSATIPTTIYDMRGQEASTHIDTTGFQAITSPSTVPADILLSSSDADIARIYYPEVEALLLKHTGASRIVFFDHTVRKPRPGIPDSDPSQRQPVLRAHVDQTPASAQRRVTRHVQPPIPYKRFQLINVWRPITNTVHDYPLAVCDAGTVDVVKDLIPTTLLYPPPATNGETYSVKHNEKQVWWYWSKMTPDDVLLLKCYDSASRVLTTVKESGAEVDEAELRDVASLTPHTAFLDEEGAKKGIKRQSIEVRALVFYD